MVASGMSRAMPPMTNTFMPMGGAIMPISMTITIMMPHHTGSNPKPTISGKTKGVVRIIAAMSSNTAPSTMYITSRMISTV